MIDKIDKKILIIIVASIIAAGTIAAYSILSLDLTVLETVKPTAQNQIKDSLPKATGNIDDIVSALLLEASSDEALVTQEYADESLATSDDSEINNFGQFYDDNEL